MVREAERQLVRANEPNILAKSVGGWTLQEELEAKEAKKRGCSGSRARGLGGCSTEDKTELVAKRQLENEESRGGDHLDQRHAEEVS